jgi:hypothetical protein
MLIELILNCLRLNIFGQAIKGYWWMPWHQQAKKDAEPAKSSGELEKSIDPEVSEWGNPARLIAGYL